MADSKPAKKRGCIFYGGLAASVLMLMLLLGVLAGISMAKKMRRDFTEAERIPLPAVTLPAGQYDQLQKRIDTFREAIKYGRETPPLKVTEDEINALISNDPDFQSLKGKVHVNIDGNQLRGQVSASMAELGVPIFQDRFLNANVDLDLRFSHGAVKLYPRNITVKGKPIPEAYMQEIRKHNLAKAFNNDPRAGVAMEKLETIEVKENQLIVTPKPAGS